ncbi:hypothetical protein CHISP_0150 [Chitinispirillum alkaliphilum]|nr:hypothetical protein CHISP_0150 [Chitinispirillum alkaliphilum]
MNTDNQFAVPLLGVILCRLFGLKIKIQTPGRENQDLRVKFLYQTEPEKQVSPVIGALPFLISKLSEKRLKT